MSFNLYASIQTYIIPPSFVALASFYMFMITHWQIFDHSKPKENSLNKPRIIEYLWFMKFGE